jgi:endonuclease/exonuclease/phosphatase (EEP) superfamily protein YafD
VVTAIDAPEPWRTAVAWLCAVVAAGAAAELALQLAGGHVGRWITSAQALTAWVVPWAIVAAVAAGLLRRPLISAGAGAVSVAYLALVAPLLFHADLPPPAGADRLVITHANLLFSNERIDDAIDSLLATDADIIALSELTPELADAIAASPMGRRYPYRLLRPGAAAIGLGIWSRVPLGAPITVDGSTMTLATTVELGGRPLEVVLAHPLPPLFHSERWRRELDAIERHVAGRADDVVVADLNVSYFHPPYRRFVDATGLVDVHQALGKGFSRSWPTDELGPPIVRLDHALVGGDVTATSITDHDLPGGDHRLFTVTVAWAAAG